MKLLLFFLVGVGIAIALNALAIYNDNKRDERLSRLEACLQDTHGMTMVEYYAHNKGFEGSGC